MHFKNLPRNLLIEYRCAIYIGDLGDNTELHGINGKTVELPQSH